MLSQCRGYYYYLGYEIHGERIWKKADAGDGENWLVWYSRQWEALFLSDRIVQDRTGEEASGLQLITASGFIAARPHQQLLAKSFTAASVNSIMLCLNSWKARFVNNCLLVRTAFVLANSNTAHCNSRKA